MSILIKGMDMPKEIDILFVYPSGEVFARAGKDLTAEQYEAIEIPPHGRLIDADALREKFHIPEDWMSIAQALVHITGIWAEIDNAPTIIPGNK